MKNKTRRFLRVTAVVLFIMLAISACAGAGGNSADAGDTGAGALTGASAEQASDHSMEESADEGGDAGSGAETDVPVSGTLSDGTYVPTMFTAEGGTGKVIITCPEVVLSGEDVQALIEFSSPHYEWVKVDGVQFDPENADEADRKNSVFRIPAVLDEKLKISALTTAMSEPHEIEYTLFISLTQKDESGTGGDKEAEAAEGKSAEEKTAEEKTAEEKTAEEKKSEPPAIEGLVYVESMETAFAETFDIYTYRLSDGSAEDTCRLIDVHDSGSYLILPESGSAGKSAAWQKTADAVPASITVLQAPLDNLYVAATSSMALFDAAGAIEQVKLTGTKADGWYIDAPKKALAEGRMTYAGKYSAPDYELLAASDCQLAVESMMILHTPEVKEKLEELGIPVFIDTSSNESHPMGRTEWVRLYGVLTGHETEAEAFFEKEKERFAEAETYTDTGLTAAFFSISSSGNVIVRATDDYIPRMIELAGGKYIFKDLLNESGNSASVRLSMEDFYNTARDADYLIYNATIENPVKSIEELCGRSALLSDFKAVQEGHVWQVQRSLYQSPDIAARMITDLRLMLTDGDAQEMTFLEQLK
jgi:iron complex transport system substrate-binding protein